MKQSRILLALLLLPLAGCANPSEPPGQEPDKETRWGLGLDMTQAPQPPYPYLDGEADVAALRHYALEVLPALLDACGPLPPFQDYVNHSEDHYKFLISRLVQDCGGLDSFQDQQELAQQAMRDGTEEETYEALHGEASMAMRELEAALANFSGPGSSAELAVAANVAHWHWWLYKDLVAAPTYMALWENGTQRGASGTDLDIYLGSAYLNLYDTPRMAGLLVRILETYPWTSPACGHPDVTALAAKARVGLDAAMALGRSRETSGDGIENIGGPFGIMNYTLELVVPHYEQFSLWYGFAAAQLETTYHAHYYELFDAEKLPTIEEALVLVAGFQAEHRHVLSDSLVRDVESEILVKQENAPHRYSEGEALLALALPALADLPSDFNCSP